VPATQSAGEPLAAERRLLQDVSHELRLPLARLGFAVELARTSENRGAALDRIQKDAGRLNQPVSELMQLTRAEGGPTAIDREAVRLDALLLDVAEDWSFGSRGARVPGDIDPRPRGPARRAEADPPRGRERPAQRDPTRPAGHRRGTVAPPGGRGRHA
jgi:signal transduction histidine kinase